MDRHIHTLHTSNPPQPEHICAICDDGFTPNSSMNKHVGRLQKSNLVYSSLVCPTCCRGLAEEGWTRDTNAQQKVRVESQCELL